jgi:intracellular septation protein
MKLSLNWALFFGAMAILNEVLRHWLTFDTWLSVKVWGITILSLLFAFANIPMLMRHGFTVPDGKDETPPIPPASQG